MDEIYRKLEIRAQSAPWHHAIEFMVFDENNMGIGTQIMFEKYELNMRQEPTFSLRIDQAQTLMDDLWNCGLRPTEGSGSAGSLKATENHLSDMQNIAFQLLEKLVGSS